MLTLNPDSVCDVCAEEYGPFNLPRCIPCGHVLCESCATTIVEKTSPRLQPACPFCREHFTTDTIRVIRIDFSQSSGGGASGPSTSLTDPLHHSIDTAPSAILVDDETVLYNVRSPRSAVTSARTSRDPSRATSRERGIFDTIDEDRQPLSFDLSHLDVGKHKERAVELEKKVAKVATKRCSAEEVQALQKELADWVSVNKTMSVGDNQQHTAIQLSNLLLRAILMNHVAHSEATRVAKGAETQLRSRIADGELIREKLDGDLRRHKNLLAAKTQEINSLKNELGRLRGGAVTPTRRQSMSAPTSPDGYFSFSSASTSVPTHSTSNPASAASSPPSSGRTTPTAGFHLSSFPGSPNGTGMSSASAAAAALQHPASPSPTSRHARTSSLITRTSTPSPAVHAVSSASSALSSNRRSMTPAPIHQRSASVAPGSTGTSRPPTTQRSMTPGIHAMSAASRSHASHSIASSTPLNPNSSTGHPNGSSVGVNSGAGGAVPPVPPIPVPAHQLSHSMNSSFRDREARETTSVSTSPGHPRPPVPPKPRTLSQSTGAQLSPTRQASINRGVVDDRDGYTTEREAKEKEKRAKRSMHERWLPTALLKDRVSRPATSLN
ncbi:hypothetical protein M0805_003132 [Coniferiporia weirii]|nr:hypothetical protein M0805_003132 [Coniferiporia weirii]